MDICREIMAQKPTDESVLHALTMVLKPAGHRMFLAIGI